MAGNDASRKLCIDRGIGLIRATNESGNTAGGFLAPQDFDAAIIAIREAAGAFRQGAETRPSGSDNQVRPRRVGGVTASFVREGAPSRDRALDTDQVLVRGVRREDIINHSVGDATTRGPMAMLVGTA